MMDLSAVNYFLEFADAIIGKKGPIVLDVNILGWAAEGEEYDQKKDIFVIGEKNRVVTYQDVSKTFSKIKKNPLFKEAFDSRDFVFEGVNYNNHTKIWKISWGS
jgi:hypothetical protein